MIADDITPLVLLILDGWGYSQNQQYNAIAAAHTPQWDHWWATCPHTLLDASGETVGLPAGQMGNSEVGHMHIGAGRVIAQDYTRINQAIANGEFYQNPILLKMIADMQRTHHAIHVLGLFSEGGVHSHEDHLFAFLDLCQQQQFNRVYLHLFLDGRDTSPRSATKSLGRLQHYLQQHPIATISSLTGRYYAMDRDQRWDRCAPVYQLLTEGFAEHHFATATDAVNAYYQQNIADEFFPTTLIGDQPQPIVDGDAVFFFNFRADRARQLTTTLLADDFSGFTRTSRPHLAHFVSMTPYAHHLPTESAFPAKKLQNTLGDILAQHALRQLRIAETEKYAHVTFFFNGGTEQRFAQEDRILIPSPHVSTYDLQPEMSAHELTRTIVDAVQKQAYDVIICNYANADMVGHSGNFAATIKAIECLDQCMQAIGQAISAVGGQLLITADHGNAELMYDERTKQLHTAHTTQPVPLLYVGQPQRQFVTAKGSLIDIAPTMLSLLNIPVPTEMTGHVLLVDQHALV